MATRVAMSSTSTVTSIVCLRNCSQFLQFQRNRNHILNSKPWWPLSYIHLRLLFLGKGGGSVLGENKVLPILDGRPSHGATKAVPNANSIATSIPETVSPLPTAGEPKYSYDVFLSFRGEDTRHGFTGHLYDALCRRGLVVFMDNEKLWGGELISPALLTAIEESRISLVVFSQNYASSTWCLDELVKILDCRKQMNQHVLPIFYKVEPSDVRHQRNMYGEAMTAYEDRFRNALGKVHKWRSALCEASNLSGFEFNTGYEYEFIERIVKRAFDSLPKRLYIGEHTVGLQSPVEEVISLLDMKSTNTVRIVGIHGTGGIGKTTLAQALYNLIVDQFVGACFLADVRERSSQSMGLVHLQETLLSKLLKVKDDSIKLSNDYKGASMIEERLCHRRVLLVLDDVNAVEQLEKLAGKCDWFGSGSRIIITRRKKRLLVAHQVEKMYKMRLLNDDESLELFCWNAFKMSHPATNYEELSKRAIRYAKGHPSALMAIGSYLFDRALVPRISEEQKVRNWIDSQPDKSYKRSMITRSPRSGPAPSGGSGKQILSSIDEEDDSYDSSLKWILDVIRRNHREMERGSDDEEEE